MEILKGFQVIKQDGMNIMNTMSIIVDEKGNITNPNKISSFYVMDNEVNQKLKDIEDYLSERINSAE